MEDVRKDRLCHYPAFTTLRGTCKKPGCKGKIRMRCIKCEVHLCLNKIEIVFLNSIRTEFFYLDFFKLHIEVYYIFFKCSRELHKIYNFIFKSPEPKQKLYCFIFIWSLTKRTIQSCYDYSAMPPREPYGPLLRFHSIYGFSNKI